MNFYRLVHCLFKGLYLCPGVQWTVFGYVQRGYELKGSKVRINIALSFLKARNELEESNFISGWRMDLLLPTSLRDTRALQKKSPHIVSQAFRLSIDAPWIAKHLPFIPRNLKSICIRKK